MSIIDTAQYEIITNSTLDAGQEAQVQWYLDVVSAYVEDYTGMTFSTQVDAKLKLVADYYGQIKLAMKPIQKVTTVEYETSASPLYPGVTGWAYDGFDTIFNLQPHAVVVVTLTYGYTTPPVSIQGYVGEATKSIIDNPSSLTSYRVGDVTDTYTGVTADKGSFQYLNAHILDVYKDTETTWALGTHQHYNYHNLPIL